LMAVMSLLGAQRGGNPTPRFFSLAGPIAAMVLVAATLAVALPTRLSTPYYHMIDREDYRAFSWIRGHLGDQYDTALLDPWKGMAFVGLAGKKVFSLIGEAPTPRDQQAYELLAAGATNTAFLQQNGVSVVYSRSPVANPDLIEVRRDVYLFATGRAKP
jgi:hypothetical protein